MKFMKNDSKKNRLELIDPKFINGIGAVLTFGAEKYKANNWKKATSLADRERVRGGMLRHLMAYSSGELTDPETGLHHLYHLSCGAMFLTYHDMHDGENPKQGLFNFEGEEHD